MWDDGVPVTILSWKRLYRDYVSRASVPMTQWPDGLTRLQDQASTLQQLMAWLAEISWIVSGTHESETLQLIDGHFTLINPRVSHIESFDASEIMRSSESSKSSTRKAWNEANSTETYLLVAPPFYLCLVSCDLKNCTKLDL
jgi:hypothetical protein